MSINKCYFGAIKVIQFIDILYLFLTVFKISACCHSSVLVTLRTHTVCAELITVTVQVSELFLLPSHAPMCPSHNHEHLSALEVSNESLSCGTASRDLGSREKFLQKGN